MRRAFIVAPIVAALLLAPSAEAHITVTPTVAPPGSDQVLTFTVPNERKQGAITRVLIAAGGLPIEAVEKKAGWQAVSSDDTVRWDGGRIEPGEFERFSFSTTMPARPRTITFPAVEVFSRRVREVYAPKLRVASPSPLAARDKSAHSLAEWALFVALAAAAVALGAWIVALGGWLKRG